MEDFTRDAPGRLVKDPQGHWAFVPNQLPPKIEYNTSTIMLLSDARGAVGELAGIGRALPNPYLLINPFLRREAILSSRIEGTFTSAEQLLLFEVAPTETNETSDVKEVYNHVRAMEHGLVRIKESHISLHVIQESHRILMEGVRGQNKDPGNFRREPNFIGGRSQKFEDARYVPPPVLLMQELLDDFEHFIKQPEHDIPVLIQLAILHYQFEAIHPFLDGNGRIGRLLITLFLCERAHLREPLLYLSAYLDKHRDEYVDHLLRISQEGAWTAWIEFFLRGVAEQASDAVYRAQRLQDLQREYQTKMQQLRASALLRQLVDDLFLSPAFTIPQAAKRLDATYHGARHNIEKLMEAGIVREMTGQQRNRVYLAPEIVAIISTEEETRT
ncbi:MAG: Fic family protein [Thermomicrobia bacterium]|nr:Fic family protein [Thermomicrobia bacterium]